MSSDMDTQSSANMSIPDPAARCWALRFAEKMVPVDLSYDSWRTKAPHLLSPVLEQENSVCWAISRIRQLEFFLRSKGRLGVNEYLSIQELINLISMSKDDRAENGGLLNPEAVNRLLTKTGIVLLKDCPLTFDVTTESKPEDLPNAKRYACEFMKDVTLKGYMRTQGERGAEAFEKALGKELKKGPVSVFIPVTRPYYTLQRKQVYNPPVQELRGYQMLYGCHELLCVGVGVDADGTPFYECQDSKGTSKGDNGYIRIAKGCRIIGGFVSVA